MVFENLTGKQILIIAGVAIILMLFFAIAFQKEISMFVDTVVLMFFFTMLAALCLIMWYIVTEVPHRVTK